MTDKPLIQLPTKEPEGKPKTAASETRSGAKLIYCNCLIDGGTDANGNRIYKYWRNDFYPEADKDGACGNDKHTALISDYSWDPLEEYCADNCRIYKLIKY